MRKRMFTTIVLLLVMALVLCSSCNTQTDDNSEGSDIVSEESKDTSVAESAVSEPEEVHEMITNLTFSNVGTRSDGHLMGDLDGPAFCVYSKKGYNKASFDIDLSQIELDLTRKSDGKFLNAYLFLGCDVYNPTANYWQNCIDAGLVFSEGNSGWHIFHSLYSTDSSYTGQKWYESSVKLNSSHKYRIELDASKKDGEATLTVYDLTTGGNVADSVTFQIQYALKSGENIRFYQDYALDFPPDTKYDTKGNASGDDWEEITLYNTDEGMYMRGVRISNVKLYNENGEYIWTEDKTEERGMWPDKSNVKIDYEVVKIKNPSFDSYFWIDFDMNRNN